MAKKIVGFVKLHIPAGKATPAPPVGPALGQQGVNIMDFCKAFNAQTAKAGEGMIIPVIVTAAYPDIEWAITLMKRGAADYLVKPVSKDDLLMVLKSAVHRYVTITRGSL